MPIEILIIPIGAFFAAFVVAAAGFGDALVLGAIWFHFLDPVEAVPLIVACGFVMQFQPLYRLRKILIYRDLPPFVIAGILGVPLGAWFLTHTAPDPFRFGIGWFLLTYGLFMLLRRQTTAIAWGGKIADAFIGFLGGILGGFAGLSGVTPTLWVGLRGWEKARQRGVFQPFVFSMHGLSVAWLAWKGLVDAETGLRLLWCLPAIAVGGWVGLKVYHLLDEKRFRQFILALLLVSGAALVL
jgi:uncharacterized protein